MGITRHIIMHQVLYIVQLPNEEGDMHIIQVNNNLEREYRDYIKSRRDKVGITRYINAPSAI